MLTDKLSLRKIIKRKMKRIIYPLMGKSKLAQLELFLIIKTGCEKINSNVPSGYNIRNYNEADEAQIVSLMKACGYSEWDCSALKLKDEMTMCVPNGHFVVVHETSKKIIGTFMARHNYDGIHLCSGRIDWLAIYPEHRGKGIGILLTAITVNRLIDIGYKTIFVGTYDEMLAAIKIYLKAGFVPNLFCQDMYGRWEEIAKKLDWAYNPEYWLALKKKMRISQYLK